MIFQPGNASRWTMTQREQSGIQSPLYEHWGNIWWDKKSTTSWVRQYNSKIFEPAFSKAFCEEGYLKYPIAQTSLSPSVCLADMNVLDMCIIMTTTKNEDIRRMNALLYGFTRCILIACSLGAFLSVGLQGSCILFCILTPNYDRLARRRLFSLTRLLFSYLSLTRALFSLLRIHLRILGLLSLGNYRSRAP